MEEVGKPKKITPEEAKRRGLIRISRTDRYVDPAKILEFQKLIGMIGRKK